MSFESTNLFSEGSSVPNQPNIDFKNPMEEYFTSKYDNRFKLVNSEGKEWNPMLYRPYNMIRWLGNELYGYNCSPQRMSLFVKMLCRGVKVYNRAIKYNMTDEEKDVYCLEDWTGIINQLLEIEMIIDLTWGGIIISKLDDGTVNIEKIDLQQIEDRFGIKQNLDIGPRCARYLNRSSTCSENTYKKTVIQLKEYFDSCESRKITDYLNALRDEASPELVNICKVYKSGRKIRSILDEDEGIRNVHIRVLGVFEKAVRENIPRYISGLPPRYLSGIIVSRFRDYAGHSNPNPLCPTVFHSSLTQFKEKEFSNLIDKIETVYRNVHTKLANSTYNYLICYDKHFIRESENIRKYTLPHAFLCAISRAHRTGQIVNNGIPNIYDVVANVEELKHAPVFNNQNVGVNDSNLVEFIAYCIRLFNANKNIRKHMLSGQFNFMEVSGLIAGMIDYELGKEFIDKYYASIADEEDKVNEQIEKPVEDIIKEPIESSDMYKTDEEHDLSTSNTDYSESNVSEIGKAESSEVIKSSSSFKDAITAKVQENALEISDEDREIMKLVHNMSLPEFKEVIQSLDIGVVAEEFYKFVKLLSERI